MNNFQDIKEIIDELWLRMEFIQNWGKSEEIIEAVDIIQLFKNKFLDIELFPYDMPEEYERKYQIIKNFINTL